MGLLFLFLYFLFTLILLISIFIFLNNVFINKLWIPVLFTAFLSAVSIYVIFHLDSNLQLISFFNKYYDLFVSLHILGVVIGLGGATISDTLFFKFLKDRRISKFEANVLETMSKIVWAGLLIITFSGFTLFLSDTTGFLQSPKFIVKIVVVSVVILNGTVLGRVISPRLTEIPFGVRVEESGFENVKYRRLAIAFGTISAISWYTAFILGGLRSIPFTVFTGLGGYFLILILGVIFTQIVERRLFHSNKSQILDRPL